MALSTRDGTPSEPRPDQSRVGKKKVRSAPINPTRTGYARHMYVPFPAKRNQRVHIVVPSSFLCSSHNKIRRCPNSTRRSRPTNVCLSKRNLRPQQRAPLGRSTGRPPKLTKFSGARTCRASRSTPRGRPCAPGGPPGRRCPCTCTRRCT